MLPSLSRGPRRLADGLVTTLLIILACLAWLVFATWLVGTDAPPYDDGEDTL
jgi:hypothetical protein